MDADRLRAYLLTLPHVAETMQWGDNLVFWTCDKSIGGKMFALINLDKPSGARNPTAPFMQHHRMSGAEPRASKPHPILSYAVGPARYSDLLEHEGLIPAPYLARAHWIAVLHWDVFTTAEWQRELRAAYDLTFAKLPKKVLAQLAVPPTPPGKRAARTPIKTRSRAAKAKAS
jgi:predicted DNA-binding protein (MmcQ/YjbR family)